MRGLRPILALLLTAVMVPGGQAVRGVQIGASCPDDLIGTWSGEFPAADLLSLQISITNPSSEEYRARITGAGQTEGEVGVWIDGDRLRFQSAVFPIAFDGRRSPDGDTIEGFLHHTAFLSHVQLQLSSDESRWEASWTPLGATGESFPIDLRVVYEADNSIAGYLFFREQRLPGFWTYGLLCDAGAVQFRDKNFGLVFEGKFDPEADLLKTAVSVNGGSRPMTFAHRSDDPNFDTSLPVTFERAYSARAPNMIGDGWRTATPAAEGVDGAKISEMVAAISSGEMTLTHSVLIARRGALVVEEYFHGFDRDTWHDTRSASKTLASALIGLAIDHERIASVDAAVLSFFPQYRQLANWDERKTRIKIRHLLTMSSGLDANDGDPESVASENAYQSQTARPDWIKFVLDAPMIEEPGSRLLYGSGNPMLLGGVLEYTVGEPVEWFAHDHLFGPLGIEHYKYFLTPTGLVYLGGGAHFRPRDLAKFGQLYLDGGMWGGKRILSEAWVRESTASYGRLENRWDVEYGYLWWRRDYTVGDRTVTSIEARGFGGQYIFVVPELELVAVITSGNYRNGRSRQPEEIIERFILPAVLPLEH